MVKYTTKKEYNTFYPKISIITPSFNQGNFLEQTILSVINQTYPNLEYIIIDGGSTDGSVEVIKKYEKYLAYWVSEPDEGQADAINKGFFKSTGEILNWLNSDDTLQPNALSMISKEFLKSPDLDIVYGNILIVDENNKIIRKVYPILDLKIIMLESKFIPQQSSFWKRNLFEKAGGLNKNLNFAFDFDLFIRFLKLNPKAKYINHFISTYRYHKESKTKTIPHISEIESNQIIKTFLGRDVNKTEKLIKRRYYRIKRILKRPSSIIEAIKLRLNPIKPSFIFL